MVLRVLFLTGHLAEGNLSKPIIRRMKADPYFDMRVADVLKGGDTMQNIDWCEVAVLPCDRQELLQAAIKLLLYNKIVIRIYGGLRGSGTIDDQLRHIYDVIGHIHLVESEEAKQNLIRFGEEEWRVHVVGLTHWDFDEPLDYSVCPPYPYALFLMNPVTVSAGQTGKDLSAAIAKAEEFLAEDSDRMIVTLPPNGDKYSDYITAMLSTLAPEGRWVRKFKERIPRNKFLGLLSKCSLYISNSSSVTYEYPALNPNGEVFNPSWRNAERTKPPPLEKGGSDRIVQILKTIDWSDKERLLRKRFKY